jgi:glutamate 5-kinase
MTAPSPRSVLTSARRLVVKVGSNLVATPAGQPNRALLQGVVTEIADLVAAGYEVLLVTSGAVRLGLAKMGLIGGPKPDLSTRQAAAAVGQVELMACYNELFGQQGCTVGQLLLTGDDIADRRRYLHIRNTLLPMLSRHTVIPVINENDSVSIEGVQIGENDRLAALIAGKVQCDLLIILSDVEGLYTADPTRVPSAELIAEVAHVTPAIERMAGGSTSGVGRGGMRSKVTAAKIAARMGVNTLVALGHHPRILSRLLSGERLGTLFLACDDNRLGARKQWVAFAVPPRGTLHVDAGAARALCERGSSLLPVGVRSVDGQFTAGDVVTVQAPEGREIARGLVNYSANELRTFAGLQTAQIEQLYERHPYDEAIHRDNLIVL